MDDRSVGQEPTGSSFSNHGARNLDTVPATIDVLPLIVEIRLRLSREANTLVKLLNLFPSSPSCLLPLLVIFFSFINSFNTINAVLNTIYNHSLNEIRDVMDQTQHVEIIDGTLVLDEATLRAAHIERKARIVIQERSIIILPETDQSGDPVNDTFGIIQLPPVVAREVAESKELEYEF